MHRANLVTGSLIVGLPILWIAIAKGKGFFWPQSPTRFQRLGLAAVGVAMILSGIFWK